MTRILAMMVATLTEAVKSAPDGKLTMIASGFGVSDSAFVIFLCGSDIPVLGRIVLEIAVPVGSTLKVE
jgi:hypothetical protein